MLTDLSDNVIQKTAPSALIEKRIQEAAADARSKGWGEPTGQHGTRGVVTIPLGPREVSITNQATAALQSNVISSIYWGCESIATAATWQDWINIAVDDRTYLVITGVFNRDANPNITQLRLKADGQDLGRISLEDMYTWEKATAYFAEPILVGPGKNLTVRAVGPSSKALNEPIGLKGYAVCKREYAILE